MHTQILFDWLKKFSSNRVIYYIYKKNKMLRKIFLLLIICSSTVVFSQKKVAQFINSLKTSSSNIKDVIPIVNAENGDFAIFIADAKNVYGYKLDSTFTLQEKIISGEKRRKYKTIVGTSISQNNQTYKVFLGDKSNKNFISFNFSFNDGKTSSKEFKLRGGDKFIQTVSTNNKLYFITTSFTSKGMFVYSFDKNGDFQRNHIDLSGIKLFNWNNKVLPITEFLTSSESVKKIEESNPNSIESVASDTKMYVKENQVIFSFDENPAFTQILTLDLTTFKVTRKVFNKSMQGIRKLKTNSYINGNTFFSLTANKDKLLLNVLDYNSGKRIKQFKILKDQLINFKNTPIIQEGGMYDGYRELEKTKKFLRKISSGEVGVAVLTRNNQFEITLGGYKLQSSGGGFGVGFGMSSFGGASFGGGNVNVFFNPAMSAYGSYTSTKSTRIECLFDENFNHIKGEIKDNAFDKMDGYDSPVLNAETVFKYKGFYLKGSYSSVTKGYSLRKFTN